MKKRKFGFMLSLALATGTLLAACGGGGADEQTTDENAQNNTDNNTQVEETVDFKVGMVTDVGGIDDKSFNQSAWEGLTKFGQENGLTEGEGYRYLQSTSDVDYEPNLTKFADAGYGLTYGVGFLLENPVQNIAAQFPESNFALIDSLLTDENWNVVWMDNVANITFKEHQGSFLVGVVAAKHTKTNKVGFIGGVESGLIKKFEVGFIAGLKSVNPDIEVISQYAGDFNNAQKGTDIANTMYQQGADIIYHAAGGTGNGVFTEAKSRKKNGEDVWVIGVDRDQHEEGLPENVTLTSMIKRVDVAVYEVSKETMEGNFPGGQEVVFGLEEEGVGIAPTTENVSEEALALVKDYEQKILSGEIEVPLDDAQLETYLSGLGQ
ncbi:BMP family ABC transporter substrate-binding protein [Bacillus sp. HMF5848]|uniref:BMP family lipoprotein n=1 Tax=Bacillus sp. HMF5848 TaxID=2495421 RepID=UPI000F798251|nr:BMP family protein [Bacillus sp. HMF5848]RSK27089.1 BMP family ABC transporter substrate-binding protein [Bacillus sp. HMF5848]